ncbi:MAG: hypothetical protein Q8916_12780 [Bacteroidota bacterium]|nr:hypothetical protein [Bacteroidota bacterium]MDP4231268.1 hypothetical protein [Bacteroidota bacterium]MDP4237174.1 hypothetical protein [Bacteroidota bacterium]
MQKILRRITVILCLILIGICFFCPTNSPAQQNNWKTFRAEGIPKSEEAYNCITFRSDSIGYLGGMDLREPPEHDVPAVLYETTDAGQSWKRLALPAKGIVRKIIAFGDTIVILDEAIHRHTTSILLSVDNGLHWKTLLECDCSPPIVGLSFTSLDAGYVALLKEGDINSTYILKYNSASQQWDTTTTIPARCMEVDFSPSYITADIFEFNSLKQISIWISPLRGPGKVISIEPCYVKSITHDNNGNAYLLTKDSSDRFNRVLKLDPSTGSISPIVFDTSLARFIQKIFVTENRIVAVGSGKIDTVRDRYRFPTVTSHLLISSDGGRHWTKDEFPEPTRSSPNSLFGDRFFIAYSSHGQFQKREFR